MDWNLVVTLVTALVALYGAILSTHHLLLAHREKERTIKVSISNGFFTFGPRLSELMILVEAANPGERTVTLHAPTLRLPDGKQVVLPSGNSSVSFPYELQEGKSCTAWIEAKELAAALRGHGYSGHVKFRAQFRDAVGNSFTSRPWSFNINEWCEAG
jgi:hypothetical protein